MNPRLSDLLALELSTMQPKQKTQFRKELDKILPQAVKTAADKAKMPAETAPVENKVTE